MQNRRQAIATSIAFSVPLSFGGRSASAQSRQDLVKIVVGFPPGGTADAVTRRYADKLRGQLAGNVMVENKPGAGGQIAVTTVKDSAPDGNTLLLSPSSCLSIYPFTYPNKLPYKPTDLIPVSTAAYMDHALAVGPAVPANVRTVRDFIAWARENPAKASYGSPAAGSMPHMIVAYISKINNLGWNHIPYRGSAPGVQDLLGGQISAMSTPLGDFLPHVKTGALRLLAVSGKNRSAFAPNTPTYREQGIPISVREWYGIFLPASASVATQRRIAAYTQTALTQPDLVAGLATLGMDVKPSTPDEVGNLLKADAEEWHRLIKLIDFNAES